MAKQIEINYNTIYAVFSCLNSIFLYKYIFIVI